MDLTEFLQIKEEYAELKHQLIKIAAQLHEDDCYSKADGCLDILQVIEKIEQYDIKIRELDLKEVEK
ncbi:hypothetical protein ACN6MY_03825 [Peribacillus sp. B-H-3]|uniref:hypothetical protein n=1 Tax=Peribacillus sp. B-H-3 TaxID=3400420 RepID=UPI003B0245BA